MYRAKKNAPSEIQGAGQDSFLDVVANIVGILIILVAIVAARVQQAIVNPVADNSSQTSESNSDKSSAATELAAENEPEKDFRKESGIGNLPKLKGTGEAPQLAELNKQLGSKVSERAALESDIQELFGQIQLIQSQTEAIDKARRDAILAAEMGRRDIEQKRKSLTDKERAKFDLQQKLNQKKMALQELESGIEFQNAQKKPAVKQLECYPTAISRPVDKSDLWLQLKGGLIAPIPCEPLKESYMRKVSQVSNLNTMANGGKVTATVGPINGFTLEGVSASDDGLRFYSSFKFIPITESVGESIDAALDNSQSRFLSVLKQYNPRTTVITLWVYEDSFLEFQEFERFLYQTGYRVASRPLPMGVNIGASPNGSKSAAQ